MTSPVSALGGLPPERKHTPAWVVFSLAVTLEYLALSFLVDAKELLLHVGLTQTLQGVGQLVPLAFLFPSAVFLTGGMKIRLRLRGLSDYRTDGVFRAVWGSAHLIAFAGVVALALRLASKDVMAPAWFAGWLLGCLLSLVTLVVTLWTPAMLFEALRGLRRELSLGFAISLVAWGLGVLSQRLWKPLAGATLELVHALVTLIAQDPVASMENALVGTSRFYVEVAPVCSGIEGVALILTFVGAYLYIERRQLVWPRAFVVLPLAAVSVWLLNILRITGLIAVGTWYSPEVALGGFHSKAGWVLFALSALASVQLIHGSRTFRKMGATPTSAEAPRKVDGLEPGLEAAYLLPLLAVLSVKLLAGLATSDFDYLYPLSVLAAALALWKFRPSYPALGCGSPWLPVGAGGVVAVIWILGFSAPEAPSTLSSHLARLPTPVAASWLAVRILGTVVTVPVVEELAFRGYLLRRFSAPDFHNVSYKNFSWLGLIVSSSAFGALHSQWGLGLIAGLLFGLLATVRGRLSDAIFAHATANAAITVWALVSGDYFLID